jgi:hypothetical protein
VDPAGTSAWNPYDTMAILNSLAVGTSSAVKFPALRPSPISDMGSLRGQQAVDIALNEVGVKEKPLGSNQGPCTTGQTAGCVDAYTGGIAESWCAHFVSWSFEQTGLSPFGHTNSVRWLRDWGKANNQYYSKSLVTQGRFKPNKGDIFTMDIPNHTGLVLSYDPGSQTITTVEGNWSDRVDKWKKPLRQSTNNVDGFIRIID